MTEDFDHWRPSGFYRVHMTGLFQKRPVLQVQEFRMAHRPKVSGGYTPDNWQRQERWVDATQEQADFIVHPGMPVPKDRPPSGGSCVVPPK